MSDDADRGVVRRPQSSGYAPTYQRSAGTVTQSTNLADLLERVLDKGIVIAGDIRVNLLDIELLTIKIRLLVASVDKAREMGIDWWEHDPTLRTGARDQGDGTGQLERENRELRQANEILRKASAYFAQAELDRRFQP